MRAREVDRVERPVGKGQVEPLVGELLGAGEYFPAVPCIADDAEQASRAGAGAIDIDHLRATGEVRLDRGRAASAASAFLQDLGYGAAQYTVNVTDLDRVEVRVKDSVRAGMLALVGVDEFDVSAEAAASPETGE